MHVVMYAFRSNMELVPVFQSAGNLVPIGIPAESGRNVPPSCRYHHNHRHRSHGWLLCFRHPPTSFLMEPVVGGVTQSWPYQRAPLIGTDADGPEVVTEAITGGDHGFHATSLWVFLLLIFAKNVAGEQHSLSRKVFPAKIANTRF